MEDFVEKLITFFSVLNTERDHKAAYLYHKVQVVNFEENSPLKQYMELLTSHSFRFVKEEYSKKKLSTLTVRRSHKNFLLPMKG